VSKLKGPPSKLTPLLKGLDAAELMALPPPDASHSEPSSDAVKLRAEEARRLDGMKVKELKKRARQTGVDDEAIEDADDAAGGVKAEVVRLILERWDELAAAAEEALAATEMALSPMRGGGDDAAREAELRVELGALKLKALKVRAREVGVEEEKLEDADDADDAKAEVVRLILALV